MTQPAIILASAPATKVKSMQTRSTCAKSAHYFGIYIKVVMKTVVYPPLKGGKKAISSSCLMLTASLSVKIS